MKWRIALVIVLFTALAGCSRHHGAVHSHNICHIFVSHPSWYWAALDAQQRWHVPMSVMMAFIHQESHYQAEAQPARRYLAGKIPWFRPTSARGYAQATDATWQVYCRNRGRISASRGRFDDAVDFIGWYISWAHQVLKIAKNNPRALYLAYHEGLAGYQQAKSHKQKKVFVLAKQVERQAWQYHHQLQSCMHRLPLRPAWW